MSNTARMCIGADYYPEHWPRERWVIDARLMKEAGFNITRLAEFAWAKLEPSEGEYDFGWLEEAVNILGEHGIRSVLCTPTPTMPKWVYDKYPCVIATDKQGHPIPFGNRQNNCFTDPTYRSLSWRITEALTGRFKENPYVAGWQLDNELGQPFCYCSTCEAGFRDWLRDKYTDIHTLNDAWGTIFWSHTYADFGECHLPRHAHSGPSLYLDFRRYHSRNVIRFAAEQAAIIRETCPKHFITHNYMGMCDAIDYGALADKLDFVSEDYYYNFGRKNHTDRFKYYEWGAGRLDFIRGIKGKSFWIMENTAGALGWETYGRNVRPGELRRMTFQNMAHGANGQIWFRWRTSRYGTEQYWHGLLDHSGIPGRRYAEAAGVSKEIQAVYREIEGSLIRSEAAILTDFEDRWAFEQQPNSDMFRYTDALMPYYRALLRRGVNTDFILKTNLTGRYKLLIMPYKYILSDTEAALLNAYVQDGGILLITCRTGVKNAYNVPHEMILPGYLREAAGVRVEEYEAADILPVVYKENVYKGGVLADWIIPESAEVIGRYEDRGIPGAAVTVNTYGKGKVYYVGTVPEDALAGAVITDALADSGIGTVSLPEHTEMITHDKQGVTYYFLLNHSDERKIFPLANITGTDLLTGMSCEGIYAVPANDAAVIKHDHNRA